MVVVEILTLIEQPSESRFYNPVDVLKKKKREKHRKLSYSFSSLKRKMENNRKAQSWKLKKKYRQVLLVIHDDCVLRGVHSRIFMKKKLLLSIEEYKEKGEFQRWPPFF
jgi:hypothetical protein